MSRLAVVKLGGELLERSAGGDRLAADIAEARAAGWRLVLVHGGGPQVTRLQQQLGLTPRLVAGRRVTDAATLEIAKMVFAGKLNTELTAALQRHGVPAVGLSGIAAGMLRVRRRPPIVVEQDGRPTEVDFGLVGDVEAVEPRLLLELTAGGYVAVLSSLAATPDGTILNVNADTVAAELAVSLRAAALLVLATVAGVYRDAARPGPDAVWPTLTLGDVRHVIADGTARDGMVPKLTACAAAVARGVSAAHVLDGTVAGVVWRALAGEPTGTRVVADAVGAAAP